MYGLIDCNNFFVSCERAFNPSLNGQPVIVLSNNDGCAIARSNEAKALGIRMAAPAFQIKDIIQKHNVQVFSSNYTLYGDMSARIMSILSEQVLEIEVYSIDEAFLNLEGIENLETFAKDLVHKVIRSTGIPVSLGIAPTKTLAKVANHFAKKYKAYNRVCLMDTDQKRIKALKLTEIEDIWGIGRRLSKMLALEGVFSAYDFIHKPQEWVRKKMTVIGERTWRELRGEPCLEIETVEDPKKQICTSRSFGQMISDYDSLAEAIATHAATCAQKLRRQKACAISLMTFIHTNRFRDDLAQCWRNQTIPLTTPSNDTITIVTHALKALKQIYAKGYQYKKAGVIITEITSEKSVQTDLFDHPNHQKSARLMAAIDQINQQFPHAQMRLAVQGISHNWEIKRELLSRHFSTRLSDVIQIKCKT